jgi:tryptophan 2,3-dioxygenase
VPTDAPSGPDPSATGFHDDFSATMSYGDYLRLDTLLDCQTPLSRNHDEMLFIVIHQATELWMKLMLHEMSAAVANIEADALQPAFKMMARVTRIQEQLVQSWTVLSTMTPADYLTFRDALGHASGFQSHQYRAIEFLLGNRDRALLAPFRHEPEKHATLAALLERPSLYDAALRLLAKRGLAIDPGQIERDWSAPRPRHPSVATAWLAVYSDPKAHWDLYELAEELVDLEDAFQTWRFRHLTTVERIIGRRRGTGGTAGVDYLQKALGIRFFPELWEIRTAL